MNEQTPVRPAKLTAASLMSSNVSSIATPPASASKYELIICESFQKLVLENLFKFKNDPSFTDICIYVDGVEFKCHKVILCAASSYFKAMFSCDLKESRLGKVYIENLSPWTMKRLLDFMYTSRIEINHDNVIDIFNAAIMFNLYNLVEKCTIYIEEHIDVSNCIDLYLFADLYQIEKLKEATFHFILENFMLIYEQNHDYVKLNESTFMKLIKTEHLNVPNEIYALRALKNWYTHSTKQRAACLETLFKQIRFSSIKNEDLIHLFNNDSFIKEHKQLINTTTALANKIRPSTLPRDYMCNLNVNKFDIYDFYKSKWVNLSQSWPPKSPFDVNDCFLMKLNGFSVCIVNNNLYLTGGIDLNTRRLLNLVWKFDTCKNKWYECANMLNERAYHVTLSLQTTSELNDYIFVFYGICNKAGAAVASSLDHSDDMHDLYDQCKVIEYYNISTDSWSVLTLANTLPNYHLFQLQNQFDIQRFILERDQLIRKKSIISLKNIIYILQSNSIYCYQFSPKLSQFICLPYFRLPDNLINNKFILLKAISLKTSSSACLSIFTWISDQNDLLEQEEEADDEESEPPNEDESNRDASGCASGTSNGVVSKHEVLIYLANFDEKLIYEFYPARNKLKKLPSLLLKHSINDTHVFNTHSAIYVTGGLIEASADLNGADGDNAGVHESSNQVDDLLLDEQQRQKHMAIEKYDYDSGTWSIFMDNVENLNYHDVHNNSNNDDTEFKFPLTNIFFKLKMSI